MRKIAQKNGITVKAYAGTTGVLVAMNVSERARKGLLGFAIRRQEGANTSFEWLLNRLNFPGVGAPGMSVPSNIAPIQKFRWSDYRVYPDTEYSYEIHAVYGTPEQPVLTSGPRLTVKTSSNFRGKHCVIFNRAAAASQAFALKFPNLDDELTKAAKNKENIDLPPDAKAWLSRGVLEQITGYINRAADKTWALDIAIYEYELPEIVEAVEAANARGVQLRVVYHAKTGDKQTAENEHSLKNLPIGSVVRPRKTSKICHHKFIVLSRVLGGQRTPQSVLCGSTNFTHNGIYRQANVVHVVGEASVAHSYLALFETLFRGDTPTQTKDYIDSTNSIDKSTSVFAGFSPRSGLVDLEAFITEIKAARHDVLFCTAFGLYDPLEDALLGAPHDAILRYGLEDKASRMTGFHADRTADFSATALAPEGLEGWIRESRYRQRGNILLHTKAIVIDFTSDSPIVISGSHNFSKAASESNDENYLILRGDTDVADSYGVELLRMYDHYRFRYTVQSKIKNGKKVSPPTLTPNNSWTDLYFKSGSLRESDRLRFVGK